MAAKEDYSNAVLAIQKDYQAAPTSQNVSVIKVSGQMRSDALKVN